MTTDEQQPRDRAAKRGLPVAERHLKRFIDAALAHWHALTAKDEASRGDGGDHGQWTSLMWPVWLVATIIALQQWIFPAIGITFTEAVIFANGIFIVCAMIYFLSGGRERGANSVNRARENLGGLRSHKTVKQNLPGSITLEALAEAEAQDGETYVNEAIAILCRLEALPSGSTLTVTQKEAAALVRLTCAMSDDLTLILCPITGTIRHDTREGK